jgi:hypothetical protein
MKKICSRIILPSLIIFLVIFFGTFVSKTRVYAQNDSNLCQMSNSFVYPNPIITSRSDFDYYFRLDPTLGDRTAFYFVKADTGKPYDYISKGILPTNGGIEIKGNIYNYGILDPNFLEFSVGQHTLTLYRLSDQPGDPLDPDSKPPSDRLTVPYCPALTYTVIPEPAPSGEPVSCVITVTQPADHDLTTRTPIELKIDITGLNAVGDVLHYPQYFGKLYADPKPMHEFKYISGSNGTSIPYTLGTFNSPAQIVVNFRLIRITIRPPNTVKEYTDYPAQCSVILDIGLTHGGVTPVIQPSATPPVPTLAPGEPTYTPIPPFPTLAPLCEQISDPTLHQKCLDCMVNGGKAGIWTAVGCLSADPSTLIKEYVFTAGVGIAGGIAFLYFLYGAFIILTSAGNAERVEEGKQIITSSVAGLLLLIFSVFLLKVVGVDILRLPGFG